VVVVVIVVMPMIIVITVAMTMVMLVVMVTAVVVTVVTVLVLMFVHAIVLARPLELAGPRKLLLTAALILRPTNVLRCVLRGADEVNGSIARIVLVAMPPPVVRMLGRNMQIQRLDGNTRGSRLDDHRLGINHRWRSATAQIHATVNTRGDLAADGDANIQVTGVRERTKRARRQGKQCQTSQHVIHLVASNSRRRADSPPMRPGVSGGAR
jgi:hypothetical protein